MKTKLLPKGLVAGRSPHLEPAINAEPVKPAANVFELHINAVGAWLLEGPADYTESAFSMNVRGFDVMNAILEGQDQVFDQLAIRRPQSDWVRCVIRRLEMDYSAWRDGQAFEPTLFVSEVRDE